MADLNDGILKENLKIEIYGTSQQKWARGQIESIAYYVRYDEGGGKYINRQDTDKCIRLIHSETYDDIFHSNPSRNITGIGMLRDKSVVSLRPSILLTVTAEKGQEIEIYDQTQQKWTIGKIHDIQVNDGQIIYCVEYDEYSVSIQQKDANSVMRMPNAIDQSNELNAKSEIPLSGQSAIITMSRMYLSMDIKLKIHYHFISL